MPNTLSPIAHHPLLTAHRSLPTAHCPLLARQSTRRSTLRLMTLHPAHLYTARN
ncbi:MAG: hypothetical protein KF770_28925 [Anaerolineae bacterium]|nr:hypothetical protein [Anaerolineae bacterium]